VAAVKFDRVTKEFEAGTRAVAELELDVRDGELMVFVGPSGCGKTTALRMVAGLEEASAGDIRIGERVVTDLDPRDRDIAMVFQNYALYPHMTVYDNIAFGLKMRRVPRPEIEQRVRRISQVLGLDDFLKRRPRQLSGGQRQRVAMGRAIIREPQVFLMDEPLSNLDARLRGQMRAEISRIQRELETTTMYVTHDQVEAMTMGHRVAVMRKGELQQVDGPQVLFDSPANLFVASFIGSPSMNLIQARIQGGGEDPFVARVGEQSLPLPAAVVERHPTLPQYRERVVGLGIRPEHFELVGGAEAGTGLRGKVILTEALGSERLVHVEIEAAPVITDEVLDVAVDVDAEAVEGLKWEASQHRTKVIARFDVAVEAEIGDQVELRGNTAKTYLFELETGKRIV
jgi:multiple sugar transport system ATP-binding protein